MLMQSLRSFARNRAGIRWFSTGVADKGVAAAEGQDMVTVAQVLNKDILAQHASVDVLSKFQNIYQYSPLLDPFIPRVNSRLRGRLISSNTRAPTLDFGYKRLRTHKDEIPRHKMLGDTMQFTIFREESTNFKTINEPRTKVSKKRRPLLYPHQVTNLNDAFLIPTAFYRRYLRFVASRELRKMQTHFESKYGPALKACKDRLVQLYLTSPHLEGLELPSVANRFQAEFHLYLRHYFNIYRTMHQEFLLLPRRGLLKPRSPQFVKFMQKGHANPRTVQLNSITYNVFAAQQSSALKNATNLTRYQYRTPSQ
eukprot:GILI01003500.1.p1 GENE.GILI01003500.1~~GILI01003500.1.p1  ORF type:complete len:311 (-),score=79.76 GILI01003500.1:305-1237(-)